jgi:hypothetical protein
MILARWTADLRREMSRMMVMMVTMVEARIMWTPA